MTDRIIQLLKNSGADAWEVKDKSVKAWEFYFIRHQLDQNRVRDVEHIEVTVYRKLEDGKFLGSATQEIAPTASDEEAQKIIADYNRTAKKKIPDLTPEQAKKIRDLSEEWLSKLLSFFLYLIYNLI